jgi:hypothetical protein
MGAETFTTMGKGATAQEAFRSASEQARYDYGHAGYTGTLAEKGDFVLIPVPSGIVDETAERKEVRRFYVRYADSLIESGDPRIDDKWGPAGCIDMGEGEFLFFGWASS